MDTKTAKWQEVQNGNNPSGIEIAQDAEYVYTRVSKKRPAKPSSSGNSLVLAATGGAKIADMGAHGGWLRMSIGFSISKLEKKKNKLAALQAEINAETEGASC